MPVPFGTYRHCDLGFIIDPESNFSPNAREDTGEILFWFDVFIRLNAGRTSLRPGRYKIIISVTGENAPQTRHEIDIEWKGAWDEKIEHVISQSLIFR